MNYELLIYIFGLGVIFALEISLMHENYLCNKFSIIHNAYFILLKSA